MNSEEAYEVWAPRASPWSPWAKPILFAAARAAWTELGNAELAALPEPVWVGSGELTTAFVVDLPGAEGVLWGLALARRGWRPLPLYNALPGGSGGDMLSSAPALVDVASIVRALRPATSLLEQLAPAEDAPPAFLLDVERRYSAGTGPQPGKFDNRSISLPTDFPSGSFLRSRGIQQVVLVQRARTEPQEDLAHTLLAWQESGLSILSKSLDVEGGPAAITVTRPSHFRKLWYRFLATFGLRRNPLGGFGGLVPLASAG